MTATSLNSIVSAVGLVYPVQDEGDGDWRAHLILADNLHVHIPFEGKAFSTADAAKQALEAKFTKESTFLPAGTAYAPLSYTEFVDQDSYLSFLTNREVGGKYQRYGYVYYQSTRPKKLNIVQRIFQRFAR